MSAAQPGLVDQIKSYPSTFWVANTMEIFERMAWYGFYAVSSLYITGPKETGGLGFTSVQRGQIQAIVPFFLYMFPVLTGALADRYGYKRMFTIAYVGMIVSYYLLGQATSMPGFLMMFMFVAIAAAIFKPVVVGTVARVTNESNSSTGFGIFYMMVNIGGFLGPMLAGVVRGWSWDYVFIACSCWAAVNLVIVTVFYKEPTTEAGSAGARTFRKVLDDAVEVLGNLRFFICVFVILISLMLPGFRWPWFTWTHCLIFIGVWLVLNLIWDRLLPAGSGRPHKPEGRRIPFYLKRLHCSNWRFALFLLIMSGFWTSFNQIFLTMPEYIRDYTETRPMVNAGQRIFNALGKPQWIDGLAAIEATELLQAFDGLVRRPRGAAPLVFEDDPTVDSVRKERADVQQRLQRLLEDRHHLISNDGANIEASLAELTESEITLQNLDRARAQVKAGAALAESIERQRKRSRLPEDPGLSSSDLQSLLAAMPRINLQAAGNPLEPLDLVEIARTFLQYKTRIQPIELAGLLEKVPLRVAEVADDVLAVAVSTINARLEARGKPKFTDLQETEIRAAIERLIVTDGPAVSPEAVAAAAASLRNGDSQLEPALLAFGIRDAAYRPVIWKRVEAGRQVNPEHIVNFDAGAIVLLQVLVSYLMAKFHRFTTMIVGMVIAAVGIGLSAVAGGTMIGPAGGLLSVVIIGIVVFAVGEMMASPTSQEYVGRIAPRDKVALYMGYYFVAIALGNLFGGILSGELYEMLAVNRQRPDLLWLAFGGIMFGTALVFMLYDKFALPRASAHRLTGG